MDIVSLLIQIVSGVVGGNAAGMSQKSLGPAANSILGGVGGVVLGQIITAVTGGGAAMASGGAMDIPTILSSIVGGGVGGAILTFVIGFIKAKMAP
ncbi:hypothetical protein SAMN04487857_104326 [Pseudomonas sp. ok272]|uniref:hypothetical protein n=1 Tax=unclassified Pseudomonas TaxID=196821 RepID=UPI0008AAFB7F|nr:MULTISPECIES: hypothetical protein [unclassified Pseudomonas]SEM74115.1 hypothetical protein SAMN04487857_104326 [Pseudomonas sp. ok272]SFM62855.1 hypothetical protein SAMN04487858_104326 [Pseudomonas sp. ok602]